MEFRKRAMLVALLLFFSSSSFAQLLSNPFPVYIKGTVVVNHPVEGFARKMLPTNNDYQSEPGCYIACYSHSSKDAVYAVTHNIYVFGMVRVPGSYINRVCVPVQLATPKLSNDPTFKSLCNEKIITCKNGCWPGGDTGGWYGVQQSTQQ